MYVKQVEMAADGPLTVSVEPSWRRSRCGTCGKRAPRYDRQPVRQWRHLSWGRMPAWLRYAPWRVSCRRCRGVKVEAGAVGERHPPRWGNPLRQWREWKVEQVPWASGTSVFTSGFEELAAYLAQVTDRTAVSRLLGISWVTVGSIVERVVARRLDGARFAKLRRIGVDEFSYRKRHRYLTIVVDHDERRVVWAGRGRSAETLGAFFEQLGPGGLCADRVGDGGPGVELAEGAAGVGSARAGGCSTGFTLNGLRRMRLTRCGVRSSGGLASEPEDAKALKGTRYALLKHPARLRPGEARRLETLRRKNRALDRAYELKEYLATILGQATPEDAPALLDEWLEWAARSRLTPFVKLGRTIRKHAEGILAYLDTKMTNGPVEGINNKLRVIARRAYGFHSPGALISMLFLCCGGIELAPPLPTRI